MTFARTAWQKAETLETGVASSVRVVYWRSRAGAVAGLNFFLALRDLGDGLDDGVRGLVRDAWVFLWRAACPSA